MASPFDPFFCRKKGLFYSFILLKGMDMGSVVLGTGNSNDLDSFRQQSKSRVGCVCEQQSAVAVSTAARRACVKLVQSPQTHKNRCASLTVSVSHLLLVTQTCADDHSDIQ